MITRKFLLLIVLALLWTSVSVAQDESSGESVQVLPLSGPLARPEAEISGLAWWNDQLLILPQFPHRLGHERYGQLYTVSRSALLKALEDSARTPLAPRPLRFADHGLRQQIDAFEGYEALAVQGNRAFMTIESSPRNVMRSHLVEARLAARDSSVRIDLDSLTKLPNQTNIDNIAYETLVPLHRRLLAIYEANGSNVNPKPLAYRLNFSLQDPDSLSFPSIEYRITDATSPDAEGRFWAMNFFYPGDRVSLDPAPDLFALQHHSLSRTPLSLMTPVERLIELQYTEDGVVRTGTLPISLDVLEGAPARNWEGIARLPGRGFLIVTDTYPRTIMAFVPYEQSGKAVH